MTELTISIFDCFPNESKVNVLLAISSLPEYSKYILRKLFGEDFKSAKLIECEFAENDRNLFISQICKDLSQFIDFSSLTEKEKLSFNFEVLPNLISKVNSNRLRTYIDSDNLENIKTESRVEKAKLQRKIAEYFGFNNYYLVYNLIKKNPMKKRGLLAFKQLNIVLENEKENVWDELEKRKQNGVEIYTDLSPVENDFLRILNLNTFCDYLIENVIKAIKFSMVISGVPYSNRLSVLVEFVKNNFYLVAKTIKEGIFLKFDISEDYFDDYYKLNNLISEAYKDLLDDPEMNIVEAQRNLHFYVTFSKELIITSLNATLDEECELVNGGRK